jgi:hypothetical protein
MSQIIDGLDQLEETKTESGGEKMKLDPFEHRPAVSFWKKVKVTLTFDRLVVLGFVLIAAFVLTYRSGVDKRTEVLNASLKKEYSPLTKPAEESKTAPAAAGAVEEALPETAPVPQAAQEKPEEKKNAEIFRPFMTIQAASTMTRDHADSELKWLKDRGQDAFVIRGKKHFVVCFGRYADKKEAVKSFKKIMAGEFKKRFKDAYVRPVKTDPEKGSAG